MINVNIKKTSSYPVSAVNIRRFARNYLQQKGITSDCELSIALVGGNIMAALARKYLGEKNSIHNVLSFTENEVNKKFIYPNENYITLGEIVICYSKAFEEAKNENKMIEEKILELVEHGILHLLGAHHE